jgi:hypothetical protein
MLPDRKWLLISGSKVRVLDGPPMTAGTSETLSEVPVGPYRDAGLRFLDQRGLVPAAEPLGLLETFQAVLRSLARAMAARSRLTQSAVSRIWGAFALQPHRVETFKLSKDPLFIEKVRDIVGLYLNPPDRALVLCVDEKAQIQALDRTQPILPMRPGPGGAPHARLHPARHDAALCGPERRKRHGDQ